MRHIQLFSRDFVSNSKNKNIVVLHGLFGSSKNWLSIGKNLSENYNVYLLDLRNHGESPHTESHTIEEMTLDIANFISNKNISLPILLGHSMGGLVSMYYSLIQKREKFPDIKAIAIQDIAPRSYPFIYDNEVKSMKLDVSKCNSRAEVDSIMATYVSDPFIRQFLQMNLERKTEGGYFWKINIDAIQHSRKMFRDVFSGLDPCQIPALFILGGNSSYIQEEDKELMKYFFPNSEIKIIPGADHYLQYTHSQEFLNILKPWLERL